MWRRLFDHGTTWRSSLDQEPRRATHLIMKPRGEAHLIMDHMEKLNWSWNHVDNISRSWTTWRRSVDRGQRGEKHLYMEPHRKEPFIMEPRGEDHLNKKLHAWNHLIMGKLQKIIWSWAAWRSSFYNGTAWSRLFDLGTGVEDQLIMEPRLEMIIFSWNTERRSLDDGQGEKSRVIIDHVGKTICPGITWRRSVDFGTRGGAHFIMKPRGIISNHHRPHGKEQLARVTRGSSVGLRSSGLDYVEKLRWVWPRWESSACLGLLGKLSWPWPHGDTTNLGHS